MKHAYIYTRVSSEEQVSNFSLSNQEEYCLKHAEQLGYNIQHVFREEGVSAKTLERPQLVEMLSMCRENKKDITALFIYKIDRLSRETIDYLAVKQILSKLGVRIISVTEPIEDNPTGEFLETMLAATAKLDNATKSLRTLDGMRKRIQSGWANGKAPLGYLNVLSPEGTATILPDQECFETVKHCWEQMATGAFTFESMAAYMNKKGLYIKSGKKKIPITRSQQTHRVFHNSFYCGRLDSEKFNIHITGKHTPMISEELFYRVQKIIDPRSRTGGMKYLKKREDFPLRGHLLCSKCREPLTASFCGGRTKSYPYYFCQARKHKIDSYRKEKVEEQFSEFLRSIQPSKKFVVMFSEMVKEKWETRYSHLSEVKKTVQKDLEALYTTRKRLVQRDLEGVYSNEVYREQEALIEDQIIAKKIILSESKLQEIDINVLVNFMQDFLWNLDKAWENGTLVQKTILVDSIFPEKLTYDETGFRTTQLGGCFKLLSHLKGVKKSQWVTDEI